MAEINQEVKAWCIESLRLVEVIKEAVKRVSEGEHLDIIQRDGSTSNWLCYGPFPTWRLDDDACKWTLKPKRALRHWTAKEWGARIGDWFAESTGQRWQLVKVMDGGALEFKNEPYVNGIRTILLSGVGTESFTNLDGSPCGVFEEVKQ